MRFSSFLMRDSSNGAEAADEDEAAADGDCIEVAAAGAVVLSGGNNVIDVRAEICRQLFKQDGKTHTKADRTISAERGSIQ